MSSCGQVVASPSRQRGPQVRAPWHHGGHGAIDVVGPVASPGRASGRGDKGVYTDWLKWPLGAVLGHSCTLLHRCGQTWRQRSVRRLANSLLDHRRHGQLILPVGPEGLRLPHEGEPRVVVAPPVAAWPDRVSALSASDPLVRSSHRNQPGWWPGLPGGTPRGAPGSPRASRA